MANGLVWRRLAAALCCVAGLAAASPALAQQAWLSEWASLKRDEIAVPPAVEDPESALNTPVALELARRPARPLSAVESERNARTISFYNAEIGQNSPRAMIWSGLETANPLTRHERYRWNALEDQGLFDATRRDELVTQLQNLGVANLRVGLANHEIDLDAPATWARHDAFINHLAGGGLNLSLDLHHFGVEDRFRTVDADGRTVPERSYYLHPDWPDYFARFAAEAVRRYGDKVKALTIVNEPETTVGFNSEMWHGAFPGWGDARHSLVYVERAFAIAAGAVKARIAIEAEFAASGRRALFMHTEGAVWKPGASDFNRIVRFLPSDLILGQRWLRDADVDALAAASLSELRKAARRKDPARRGSVEWLLDVYVFHDRDKGAQALRRDRLVALISGLKALHAELLEKHGATMRDDTVFAADYYAHNEERGASGVWLDPQPQLYAAQVAAGERRGLYPMLMDYFDRYGLPMMIGETGTPFYAYGARWHAQMLLESAAAMEDGAPMLGYTIYPLVDTYGWETALSVPKAETSVNTGGLMTLALEARPFARALLNSLNTQTAHAVESDASVEVR